MTDSDGPADDDDLNAERVMRRKSRRSFLAIGIGAAAAYAGWKWLRTRSNDGYVPYPVRRALEFNQKLAERYFTDSRLAPTFPREMAEEPRVNGDEGLRSEIHLPSWRLEVIAPGEARSIALEDIQRLPRVEMTTEHKCIEGWSVIVNWAGARFRDFAAQYSRFRHVGLATPDGRYYVGMDMPSALHPQTLLCYAMNGEPLSLAHGAPLRLVTTVKYGI